MFEAKKNEKSRQELLKLVRELEGRRDAIAAADGLKEIERLLGDSGRNASREVPKIDAKIKNLLEGMRNDLSNGKSSRAAIACKKIVEEVKKRNEAKIKGGKSDLGSDEVQANIEELTEEKEDLEKELERVKVALQRDPKNHSIATKAKTIISQIKTIDEKIRHAEAVQATIDQGKRIDAVTDHAAEIDKYVPDAGEMNIKVKHLQDSRDRTNDIIDRANEVDELLDDKSGATLNSTAGLEDEDLYAQIFGGEASTGSKYGSTSSKTTSRSSTAPKAAAGDSPDAVVDQLYEESEDMLEDIEDANNEYEDKLAEERMLSEKEAGILRDLLIRRKTATAAECSVLDSDIRHHKAVFASHQNRIKMLSQARAYNDELLVAVNSARDLKDINEIKSLIDRNAALIRDPEKAALAIKAMKEKGNEDLDLMSTVNAVIGSTDIDDSSLSSSRISGVDISGTSKNDDEFADLEQMLGLR